jgi:hypothetical protein
LAPQRLVTPSAAAGFRSNRRYQVGAGVRQVTVIASATMSATMAIEASASSSDYQPHRQ